jgi:molecular chaperone DnaK
VITQRLKDAAERAKIELSGKSAAQIDLPYITIKAGKFKDYKADISREQLNDLTADLVDRTVQVCMEVLDAADHTPEDVGAVLLVGGQTRMPLVQEKVSQFFGKAPTKGVHPDEVVACGAALMGHSLTTETSVRLIDVLPLSIGGRQPNGSFKVLFEANSTLPSEREVGVATTHDNQTAIEVFLYQGESPQSVENEFLGAFVITGFSKAPKGKTKLAVNMSLNQESILEVTAKMLETSEPMHVQMIARAPISAEEVGVPVTPGPEAQAPKPMRRFSGLRSFIRRISTS